MKKDVFISIRGVQRVEGQEETIELLTVGNLYKKKNDYYISYEETEATGFGGSKTTVRLEDSSRVTMLRSKPYRSQLIIENGRRHQCYYDTGYGDVAIGVLGSHISSTLTDEGGNVRFAYSLDVNTSLASENEVSINVRACE